MSLFTLSAELKDTLTSLDGERIEQLLAWHLADDGAADVTSFLSHLYREGLITHIEYTRAQLQASVEVTAPTVIRRRPRQTAPGDDAARADAVPDDFPKTILLDDPSRVEEENVDFIETVKMDTRPRPVDDDFPRTVVLGDRGRGGADTTRDTLTRPVLEPTTETAAAATAPPAAPRPATTTEPPAGPSAYTMLDAIDEGGMGEILLARDNELGRTVAFKKIHARVAEYTGMVERFFMEAQVTAQLQHPYIVPVYQLVKHDGELGYAMKLVAGKTLGQLFGEARQQLESDGRLDDEHATQTLLEHFLKVCDAIHYANRKGVLHRDLKPANIMVGAYNEVYVMDWGIARLLDGSAPGFEDVTEPLRDLRPRSDEDRTQLGEVIGTPAYMSPEQARGDLHRLDHRSDQYALGLVLFELLTLNRARSGADPDELDRNARDGVLAPMTPFHPSLAVAKPLAAILARATHVEPEQRYASTRDFADDIRHYLHNEAVAAMPDTLVQKLGRWVVRHRVATMNIAAYSLIGLLAVAGLGVYRQQQTTIAAEQREVHVGHMLSTVSAHAGAIDTRLLRAQGILEGLAVSAAGLYTHARAEDGVMYTDADYRVATRAPPDLVASPAYGTGISVDWPVYALAPGIAMNDVETTMRKVDALRHGFRALLLRSRDGSPGALTGDAARDLVVNARLPVHRLQLGFASGFVMAYPGHAGYPVGYDPRNRPWYVQAIQARGTRWLAPFREASGGDGVLGVATPIVVDSGETVGVAAVEMTLASIQRDFLAAHALPGIERLLLLDETGGILAVSGQGGEHGANDTTNTALPESYRATVLADIGRQRSGFLAYDDDARKMLLSWHRLDATGWYLLAEADADAVLALY